MVTRELCSFFVRAIVYIRAFAIFCCIRSFFEQLSLMPQQLNVLRCYSCKMYQVHIVKKSRKWQCKICNEKQSIQTIYLRGTGSECRNYVQARNLRGASTTAAEDNFRTAVIDGWGLDCEADDRSEDPCDCSSRKMAIAKFSHNFTDCNDSVEKENEYIFWKRRRLDAGEKRSCSLPVGEPLSTRDSRSQSFPQSKRMERPSKWDKFVEGGKTKSHSQVEALSQPVNKLEVYEVENTEDSCSDDDSNGIPRPSDETIATGDLKASQVDSDTSSPTFRHIGSNFFGDSNDKLDLDLDF